MSKQKPYPPRHRRRLNTRARRKKYLIVTEGHTEAAYFGHFHTSTKLEIIIENPKNTKQLGLVQKTIELRNDRAADADNDFVIGEDEVWVVFDRDIERANPNDHNNFRKAIALAKASGINIALSNDSFELWHLLHFQEVSGPMTRQVLNEKLGEHLKRSYKSRGQPLTEDLWELLRNKRPQAIARAKRLHVKALKESANPEHENPFSTVYLLIERIMNEDGFRES